ncbi:type 1 glutamine amidotransferase [Pseudomarimonas salicorniae]|uniref:Type 1 glutamine amidotransferase n=1 Tax=Pseudomarimonas salicorniae TaxID=2933270 RepID=A0ABT0GF01_9GAMM|nr:type 1 glutamine amidotransferase [Lysobacter sp. CAU 1642]MCK7593111.1 type 1 glutamine amidotransferase [Lysobacter sp. CAU 1642]
MSRILVFQHVAAEPLGTLDALIRRRGHRIRFVNFEREPDARPVVDRYRGLVVLGGPMNVGDVRYRPHLLTELRCIERMLSLGRPVLGICLGSQLLAHALGAPVRRHSEQEIGWYRWLPREAAASDGVLGALPEEAPIFQWHGCTFDLPEGAAHLGSTAGCPNQAFRWGDSAYGLQFHLEMDLPLIRRWLGTPAYRQELLDSGLGRTPEQILDESARLIDGMQAHAETVFGRFLDLVGRPEKRIVLPSREWA